MPKCHRVYDDMLPSDLCKRVIETFEKDTEGQVKGRLLDREVRYGRKNCTDLGIGLRLSQGGEAKKLWEDIDGEIYKCVAKSWELFQNDSQGLSMLSSVELADTGYQIQRYEPNEGLFAPHIDSGSIDSAFRIAAAVIYFNTVKEGGGTRFPEWDETVDAVEGRILWFPSGWTHIHEGLVPLSGRKYIASTFMCFKGYGLLDRVNGPCYQHIMQSIAHAQSPSA